MGEGQEFNAAASGETRTAVVGGAEAATAAAGAAAAAERLVRFSQVLGAGTWIGAELAAEETEAAEAAEEQEEEMVEDVEEEKDVAGVAEVEGPVVGGVVTVVELR
jgi:hypothetical protein